VSNEKIDPIPPFIWPEPRITIGQASYAHPVPFYSLFNCAESFFGIIYDLDHAGINLLGNVLREKENLKCTLIVVLYPACATDEKNLNQLLLLKSVFLGRLDIHILPQNINRGGFSSVLCFFSSAGKVVFLNSPAPNFGLTNTAHVQASFVFEGDQKLLSVWKNWFDFHYTNSVPLSKKILNIPHLVPAKGSPEAAEIWSKYVEDCWKTQIDSIDSDSENDHAIVNEKTGEVTVIDSDGKEKTSPTEKIGIPRFDPLVDQISRLFEKGLLVSFDKTTRIKPFDAPIKAEWFGVESLRKEGSISREVKYRISVLDRNTLRALNNKKQAGSRLLEKLSYSIGEGMHWVPTKAIPLLKQEMERITDEGHSQIFKSVNGDIKNFIQSQVKRIMDDANRMYQEFHPHDSLSDDIIQTILKDLEDRLGGALKGKFLPDLQYLKISFQITNTTELNSSWSQPLLLLKNIAEFPRKSLTDSYFFQGLRIKHDDLIDAMNVCNDSIIADYEEAKIEQRAYDELVQLNEIIKSESDNRTKCENILKLISGNVM
jgi:hypothetical protein